MSFLHQAAMQEGLAQAGVDVNQATNRGCEQDHSSMRSRSTITLSARINMKSSGGGDQYLLPTRQQHLTHRWKTSWLPLTKLL